MQWPKIDWQGWGRTAAFTATVLAALWSYAPAPQPNPEPPKPVVVTVPEKWIITDSTGVRIDAPDIEALAGKLKPDTFTAHGEPKLGEKFVTRTIVVSDDTVPPKPPVPPEPPKPPEPPGPVVPPVVSGKRALLLIHESADDTPEVSRLIVSLRSGAAWDYLKSKGHTLHVLDDDAADANGKPAAELEPWRPHFAGMKLPALFVLSEDGKTLIHKQELPAGTTGAQVVEIVKGKGG